jgi:hypothetical protein
VIPLKRKQNKENQAKPTSRSARIAEKKRGKVTTSALIVDKVTSNTKFNSIVSFHLFAQKDSGHWHGIFDNCIIWHV